MNEKIETVRFAKKASILAQILTNYRKEKQALIHCNLEAFQAILEERRFLIDALKALPLKSPRSPLQRMQQQHLEDLIGAIQSER